MTEQPTTTELVFVYGTLLCEQPNHCVMEAAGGQLLGAAVTVSGDFCMASCGPFPAVFQRFHPHEPWRYVGTELEGKPDDCGPVIGELYRVDDMAPLDRLEGYPQHYSRHQCCVQLEDGQRHLAWIYTQRGWTRDLPLVPGNDWAAYVHQQEQRAARSFLEGGTRRF